MEKMGTRDTACYSDEPTKLWLVHIILAFFLRHSTAASLQHSLRKGVFLRIKFLLISEFNYGCLFVKIATK